MGFKTTARQRNCTVFFHVFIFLLFLENIFPFFNAVVFSLLQHEIALNFVHGNSVPLARFIWCVVQRAYCQSTQKLCTHPLISLVFFFFCSLIPSSVRSLDCSTALPFFLCYSFFKIGQHTNNCFLIRSN